MTPQNRLKDKNFALFFTYGVSLKTWHEMGMIDREVALYNRLSKYFKRIYFFTYGSKEDLDFQSYLANNITIVPVPFLNTSKPSKILCLFIMVYSFLLPIIHYKILRKADILKTNQMPGSWCAIITKILFRKKLLVRTGYIWSIFANKKNPRRLKNLLIRTVERIAYRFSDEIIVSSYGDLEYLRKNYNLKGNVNVIPNYIDTDVFKPLHMPEKRGHLCFVGRLNEQKNLFSLLEALVSLPYTLTIIGSGPQREDLEDFAREKGINVEFLGNLPNNELPDILNQHEIFILPSLYEGMPKTLLEAMACGLPVIGTGVEGISEVIENEENGISCKTSSKSIKQAIITLMKDEKMKKKLGENARKTIMESYSLDNLAKEELKLMHKLVRAD
jgi:glycosyltransferase involved in cell wall biosynthesis